MVSPVRDVVLMYPPDGTNVCGARTIRSLRVQSCCMGLKVVKSCS